MGAKLISRTGFLTLLLLGGLLAVSCLEVIEYPDKPKPEEPQNPPVPPAEEEYSYTGESFSWIGTGFPTVVLDTPGAVAITSKTVWTEGASLTIYNPDGSVDCSGELSIKGRGNSSWTQFPKKSYSLKLETKSKVLGMPEHKRWCLLANWMDRTLIRNAVAFEISRRTGLAWTPSGRFVELVLNGEHVGNYYLCEHIKMGKYRVNIPDGFLMECDLWYDEEFKFTTPLHNVPWQFKDPDVVTEDQVAYMKDYVDRFEVALYSDDKFAAKEWLDYIDPGSFADWWMVNELCQNSEINQPKSCFIYKALDGKLTAGPVWDFDWGTFMPKTRYNYVSMGPKFYVNRMFQDLGFRRLIKERWATYRDDLATIPEYIDELAATLTASDKLNIAIWPISRTTNGDVDLSYPEAVARLKQAYTEKFNWLDTNINNY